MAFKNIFGIWTLTSSGAMVYSGSSSILGGPFVVGSETAYSFIPGIQPNLQTVGDTYNTSTAGLGRFSADAIPPYYVLSKSRGAVGAEGAVSTNDYLGHIRFSGSDGVNQIEGAGIYSQVSGGVSTDTMPSDLVFATNPGGGVTSPYIRLRIYSGGNVTPGGDNSQSIGSASYRWSVVYAATGTINTSDAREKQQIKPIDDAVLRAWAKVEYCQFKFNDAVQERGDGARWHIGLIAQRVKEAFESEGLDAFEYGLLCYDEWDEVPEATVDGVVTQEYKPAGNRYGIRYEEALALECAYLRSLIK